MPAYARVVRGVSGLRRATTGAGAAALAVVPLWGIPVWFVHAPRRVPCPEHGVVVEQIPWNDGKRRLTTAMMGLLPLFTRFGFDDHPRLWRRGSVQGAHEALHAQGAPANRWPSTIFCQTPIAFLPRPSPVSIQER